MNAVFELLISQVAVPLLLAGAAALGGWLMTLLPGPLKNWLQSGTHERDVALVVGAMARRALAISAGAVNTVTPAADVTRYVRAALPETIAKLAPSDDALTTMAMAALQRAAADRK